MTSVESKIQTESREEKPQTKDSNSSPKYQPIKESSVFETEYEIDSELLGRVELLFIYTEVNPIENLRSLINSKPKISELFSKIFNSVEENNFNENRPIILPEEIKILFTEEEIKNIIKIIKVTFSEYRSLYLTIFILLIFIFKKGFFWNFTTFPEEDRLKRENLYDPNHYKDGLLINYLKTLINCRSYRKKEKNKKKRRRNKKKSIEMFRNK